MAENACSTPLKHKTTLLENSGQVTAIPLADNALPCLRNN
jgi:hypothetical protein